MRGRMVALAERCDRCDSRQADDAPSRVSEEVDVGCPARAAGRSQGAALGRDGRTDQVPERVVERGAHAERRREGGWAVLAAGGVDATAGVDAVQRLAGREAGHAQPRDAAVCDVGDLLFESREREPAQADCSAQYAVGRAERKGGAEEEGAQVLDALLRGHAGVAEGTHRRVAARRLRLRLPMGGRFLSVVPVLRTCVGRRRRGGECAEKQREQHRHEEQCVVAIASPRGGSSLLTSKKPGSIFPDS